MSLSSRPLSPSMHWGQLHKQDTSRRISRRIYDFEWLLLLEGEAEVRIGDSEAFRVRPGQLFLLPARIHHEVSILGQQTAAFLGIHFDFYNELYVARDEDIIVHELGVREQDFCVFPEDAAFEKLLVPASIPSSPEIEQLMRDTIELFTHQEPLHHYLCQGSLLRLLVCIIQQHRQDRAPSHSPHEAAIRRAALQIEENLSEDWCNSRLAQLLHLSEDYMIRLFNQVLGHSPSSFVQRARHREARRLLRDTDAAIEVIGTAVGYHSLHYFSRAFARLEGIPASEYRKLSRML
ncbi:helix-turn-helix domain-containing protein [Paenibacillus sp. GCM10023252]|uniref:AraC family transcriptional regulator n=1 Tax=Paenibacillus sp. GCM10023252 TaxID=3252649 RepID=UPI003613C20E